MRSNRIMRFIENRRLRFVISLLIGLVVFVISEEQLPGFMSFMITWIAFATSNLFFSWILILSFHPKDVKALAEKEDTSGTFIFMFVLLSALFSLVAIVFLLLSVPGGGKPGISLHVLLSFASVFCSWTLVHTLFTLRYAHLYYGHAHFTQSSTPGLNFPEEDNPDYLDFAYFSFILGMTFQVSDVSIQSRKIRRLALLHSLLSFAYNTVIVALSINIISGVIAK